jgi:hypothetical protein
MDRAQPLLGNEATLDATEADLAEARARLTASLQALNTRIDELRDWRAWVRRHPAPFLVGAFALGALLGWRGRR